MYETIWKLRPDAIADESVARPLIEAVASLPGFEPDRYDLNQMESWRVFEVERAVVDALTQRTQLFRLGGESGFGMIAMGKHGEQPTVVVRWAAPGLEAVWEGWDALFAAAPIEELTVTGQAWRAALRGHGVQAPMAVGFPVGKAPADLAAIAGLHPGFSYRKGAKHEALRLTQAPDAVDEAQAEALREAVARLNR